MADQAPIKAQRLATLKTGERVILDPGVTTQNIMLVSSHIMIPPLLPANSPHPPEDILLEHQPRRLPQNRHNL